MGRYSRGRRMAPLESKLSAWWDSAHTIVRRTPTWMRISRGRRMAPLEYKLSAWWDTAHTIVRRAHLDADLRRTVAPL